MKKVAKKSKNTKITNLSGKIQSTIDSLKSVEIPDALKSGIKGIAIGGGAAATLSAIRAYRDYLDDKKKEENRISEKPGKNTIVLTLPKKTASARDSFEKIESNDGEDLVNFEHRIARDAEGKFTSRFGTSEKEASIKGSVLRYIVKHPTLLKATKGIRTGVRSTGKVVVPFVKKHPKTSLAVGSGLGVVGIGGFSPANHLFKDPSKDGSTFTEQTGNELRNIGLATAGITGGFMLVNRIAKNLEKKKLEKEVEEAQQEYLDQLVNKSAEDMSKEAQINEIVSGIIGADILNNFKSYSKSAPGVAAATLATLIGTAGAGAYLTKKFLDNRFKEEDDSDTAAPVVNKILFKSSEEIPAGSAPSDPSVVDKAPSIPAEPVKQNTKVNPDEFFTMDSLKKLIGDHKEISRRLAQKYFASQNPGRVGNIMALPKSWFATHTSMGRNMMANQINEMLGGAFQKTSAYSPIGLNPLASFSILSDTKNKDLEKKIDLLIENSKSKKNKKTDDEIEISGLDEEANQYIEQNKEKIDAIVRRMKAKKHL